MARREGLEPPTFWSVARCSIQLSYRRSQGVRIVPQGSSGCKTWVGIRNSEFGIRNYHPPSREHDPWCWAGPRSRIGIDRALSPTIFWVFGIRVGVERVDGAVPRHGFPIRKSFVASTRGGFLIRSRLSRARFQKIAPQIPPLVRSALSVGMTIGGDPSTRSLRSLGRDDNWRRSLCSLATLPRSG